MTIWPLLDALARVTQEYAANPNSVQRGGHTGMDFRAMVQGVAGDPILAEDDGTIVFACWSNDLGWPNQWYVATSAVIPHPQGAGIVVGLDTGPVLFIHGHLSRTDLNAGDKVKQGDIIGYMGQTGYSFGVHLHLDCLPDKWNVNSADGRFGRINPRSVIDGVAKSTVAPNQRVTGPNGVKRRAAPDKNSQQIEIFATDLILTFRGFVHGPFGTDPYGDGNDRWFVGAFGEPSYFHSSGFLDQDTHDLPDLTVELSPPVVTPPPVIPDPGVPPTIYDFPLAFAEINGITVEKLPANITNVDVGNFPADPGTAVCHWWNDLAHAPAFDSVVSEFQRAGTYKSAFFVVDFDRIGQMVGLKDRAYHAGPGGNGWYGVEISPYAIEKDAAGNYTPKALRIQANVRALLRLLEQRDGHELALTLHKNVPGAATACSDLDLSTFRTVVVPPVVPPPIVVVPDPVPLFPSLDDTIRALVEFYKS